MIQYQQILYETRPELIIECGTAKGGSGLYFAHLMDLLNIKGGTVISIDINSDKRELPKHPRLVHLTGSTLDKDIFAAVSKTLSGKKTMVSLDSDHSYRHVIQELELYHPLVTSGQYLVVEDTADDGLPAGKGNVCGANQATEEFLQTHGHEYERKRYERQIMFSCNPGSWLLRK